MKISIIFLFMKTSADLISYNRGWNNLNDHYSNRISSISENGHKKKTLDPEIQLLLHLLHQKKNHLFIKEKIGNVRRTPKKKSRKNYRLKLYKKSFWKLTQINKIRIFQFSLQKIKEAINKLEWFFATKVLFRKFNKTHLPSDWNSSFHMTLAKRGQNLPSPWFLAPKGALVYWMMLWVFSLS